MEILTIRNPIYQAMAQRGGHRRSTSEIEAEELAARKAKVAPKAFSFEAIRPETADHRSTTTAGKNTHPEREGAVELLLYLQMQEGIEVSYYS